jgi:hypothetical protein
MHKPTKIGFLVRFHPERAKAKILARLRAAGGNASIAAEREGVDYRTFTRWIAALDGVGMRKAVKALRAELASAGKAKRRKRGSNVSPDGSGQQEKVEGRKP